MLPTPRHDRVLGRYALVRPVAEQRSWGVYLALSGAPEEEEFRIIKARTWPGGPFPEVVRVDHPNIAAVVESGQFEDEAYLVLRRIDGRDLFTVWNRCAERRIAIPIAFACAIVTNVLAGLDYVHRNARVHGQISASKVMLSFEGSVRLLDFQLAQAFAPGLQMHSRAPIGRSGYWAPERLAGHPLIPASDIFPAGILLWELLVGRPLFPRPSLSDIARDGKRLFEYHTNVVMKTHVPPPSSVSKRVPAALDPVVARALASAPADRFGDANEFSRAIAQVCPPEEFGPADIGSFVRALFESDISAVTRSLAVDRAKGRELLAEDRRRRHHVS